MGMMDFLKKPKAEESFAETAFECKQGCLTIEGGAHGFGKKHDAIAHLRRFAGRNEM